MNPIRKAADFFFIIYKDDSIEEKGRKVAFYITFAVWICLCAGMIFLPEKTEKAISRDTAKADDAARLEAKLYEINPLIARESITTNNTTGDVTKVVSYSFPFAYLCFLNINIYSYFL